MTNLQSNLEKEAERNHSGEKSRGVQSACQGLFCLKFFFF